MQQCRASNAKDALNVKKISKISQIKKKTKKEIKNFITNKEAIPSLNNLKF